MTTTESARVCATFPARSANGDGTRVHVCVQGPESVIDGESWAVKRAPRRVEACCAHPARKRVPHRVTGGGIAHRVFGARPMGWLRT